MNETSSLSIDGRKIEFASWGAPNDGTPTIVFLHDGLGSAGQWRDFPEKLAEATGLPALAFSRLGYGDSDPCGLPRATDYMEGEAVGLLPAFLSAKGVGRYILFGHSDGGSIALLHAILAPTPGLLGIVTEAAHVFCEELTLTSIRRAREDYDRGSLRDRLARHHGKNADCAFLGWSSMWLNPEFATFDFRERLAEIHCPVLAIQGLEDEYGTKLQIEAIGAVPRAETRLVSGCGHTPHREQPTITLGLSSRFIRSLIGKGNAVCS